MSTPFKDRLKAGEILVGSVVTSAGPDAVDALSRLGFDWFWIDMEHAALGLAQTQAILQVIGGRAASLIRVPWNDHVHIKQALDLGCDGVMIPEIRSAEEAREAVAACRYPPVGNRSVGLARAQGFGIDFNDYLQNANDRVIVALQIEHIDGVNNIEEITDEAGCDAIVIGPYDLSASLGLIGQVGHPEVQAAITRIKTVCNEKGVAVGIFAADAETANHQIESGCSLVAISNDISLMCKAARETLAGVRVAQL